MEHDLRRIRRERLRSCTQLNRGAEAPVIDIRSGARNGGTRAVNGRYWGEGVLCRSAQPLATGINDDTSGLLRQYLPKGSDLSGFTQKELDEIALETEHSAAQVTRLQVSC